MSHPRTLLRRGITTAIIFAVALTPTAHAASAPDAPNPNDIRTASPSPQITPLTSDQKAELVRLYEEDRQTQQSPRVETRGVWGWVRKAAVYALRHWGHKLPSRFVPWAEKAAGYLEQASAWQRMAFELYMINQGMPPDLARSMAEWLEIMFGF